jgi:signal transduction histidine kinase
MVQSTSGSHRFNRNSWLAWTLCAIVSIVALVDIVLISSVRPTNDNLLKLVGDTGWSILQIVFAVVAALIISHKPGNRIGWLLMTPALMFTLDQPIAAYLGRFTSAPEPTLPILLMTWFEGWSWLAIIFPLLWILLLFPTGSPPSPRWRWVLFSTFGMLVFFLLWAGLVTQFSQPDDQWSLRNPIGFIPDGPVNTIILAMWVISLALLTVICAASLFVRYRRSATIERLQIKWLLFAAGVFVLFYIPLIVWQGNLPVFGTDVANVILFLLGMLFPVAIAIAILRYRLFDIDILINRTLVYGTLTALVIGLYVLIVGYLGALVRTENSLVISLFATGLVAVLFQPLRDRLQLGVNRLMYGRRDEPVAVLSQLGARLEETILPDEILPRLVDTVAQALKLPYVALALQVGDQWKIQAESGHATVVSESMPLIYQSETIGQLLVSRRAPNEEFNTADRLLLTNIARQAGAVAYSVRLNAALQESRQQLVTAREEERRRLRRDLHDGLGPQLASQTLTIDAISKLMQQNPKKTRELLDHLKSQSQAAIQDIRRLVYDLRPPALDELGLAEALREGVRQYGLAGNCVEIITTPNPLPALPAAVEVAVYRITQEAITNVIRHAQAKQCNVSIATQDHHLDLTIVDDGTGYPNNFHFGVGLNSMRERAEELGGHIHFENQPDGGARVQVWLPLPGDEE